MIRISRKTVDNKEGLGDFLLTDDLIPQQDGSFAVPFAPGASTFLSQRDGEGKWTEADTVNTNEKGTVDGNTITYNIPEGCFTYALIRGVRRP